MFRNASNIRFYPKRRYKMAVSRHVEISFYRGSGRTRGRGFGALAQVFGRTAIPSLRTYIVAAAKRVGADLLEVAAPEFAEVVKGGNKFKQAAKNASRHTVRKPFGTGRRKKGASRVISTNSAKQTSRSQRDNLTNIFH